MSRLIDGDYRSQRSVLCRRVGVRIRVFIISNSCTMFLRRIREWGLARGHQRLKSVSDPAHRNFVQSGRTPLIAKVRGGGVTRPSQSRVVTSSGTWALKLTLRSGVLPPDTRTETWPTTPGDGRGFLSFRLAGEGTGMGGNEGGSSRAGTMRRGLVWSPGGKRTLVAPGKGSDGAPGECEGRPAEEVEAGDSWFQGLVSVTRQKVPLV